jgi:hypothetical protein
MKDHMEKLAKVVIKRLEKRKPSSGSTGDDKISDFSSEPHAYNIFRGLWLARETYVVLERQPKEKMQTTFSKWAKFASVFAKNSVVEPQKLTEEGDRHGLYLSVCYALKYLHTLCRPKTEASESTGEETFLTALRKDVLYSCCDERIWKLNKESSSISSKQPLIPIKLVKDLFEAVSQEDFQEVCAFIIEKMVSDMLYIKCG